MSDTFVSSSIFRIRKFIRDHVYDVDHILLFERELDQPNKFRRMQPKDTDLHVAATESEVAPMIKSFPERADFFREYISSGIKAFFAEKDGSVPGYVFATQKDHYDRHLWKNTVSVGPGQFFHFAGYVAPSSRGSIVTLFILQGMHDHFKEKGLSTAITTISSRNEPSWRLCLKFGFEQKDTAWDVYKVFGIRWSRPAPVRIWVE